MSQNKVNWGVILKGSEGQGKGPEHLLINKHVAAKDLIVQSLDSEFRSQISKIWIPALPIPAVGPRASGSPSLGLSFLTYKMGI